MEATTASTNHRPKRRPGLSRRASMSALPTYADEKHGFNKKELQAAYKEEKKLLKKAHQQAEKNFRKTFDSLQYEPVSGLAEQEETMITKVSLETFDRPKASRRSRRASLNMTLQILDPIQDVKLDLEEIQPMSCHHLDTDVTTPAQPPATMNRRGMLKKSLSCQLDAEALAGWKTITFDDGPLGLQLEPTVGDRAARVTGFRDTKGIPSAARATGQIEFNDVVVKVNTTVPKSYEETLFLLGQGGERNITFRPSFGYEVDPEELRKSKKKNSHKKKDKKKKDKKSSSSHHKKKKDKKKKEKKHRSCCCWIECWN